MRTGLFFGSFNPVHRGHEEMVSSFLGSGLIDDLWIVLTPSPPHKHISGLASFPDRWKMLELLFSGSDVIHLSDVEQRLTPPHYTVPTLTYLSSRYSDRSLYLCMGGDSLQTLSTWYEYQKISSKCELLVAERPGIPVDCPVELGAFTIHICEHRPVAVSSTEIRKKLSAGLAPGPGEISPLVLAYIRKNQLYDWQGSS